MQPKRRRFGPRRGRRRNDNGSSHTNAWRDNAYYVRTLHRQVQRQSRLGSSAGLLSANVFGFWIVNSTSLRYPSRPLPHVLRVLYETRVARGLCWTTLVHVPESSVTAEYPEVFGWLPSIFPWEGQFCPNQVRGVFTSSCEFCFKMWLRNFRVVISCLERVCQWIHAYLDRQLKGDGAALFKIRAHAAFYAACHIPFYVVAARHQDFDGNRKCNRRNRLNNSFTVTTILFLLCSVGRAADAGFESDCQFAPKPSSLLPLNHSQTVCRIRVTPPGKRILICLTNCKLQCYVHISLFQVVFCHTIMVRNQRLCIPEATADTFVLDTEYPFEKYLLPGSASYVAGLVADKPIGRREESLYDSEQVMEELMLSESPRLSSGGGFMHHFLAWWSWNDGVALVFFLVCYFSCSPFIIASERL